MAKQKKQHYVPRFYLRNFSVQYQGTSIGIFNIENKKFIPNANLKNQAYKDYFYDKNGVVENLLSPIESKASSIISNIIKNDSFPVRFSADHYNLLTFIVLLQARTQYTADEINEMVDKFVKQIASRVDSLKDKLDEFRVGFVNSAAMCLKFASMSLPITRDLNYKLLINRTQIPFITSDNPVVLYNQFLETRKKFGSNIGLAVKGLKIFLPLSPKYCILFFDEGVYHVGNEKDKAINITRVDDTDSLNCLHCVNSYRNVYFNEDIPLEYITEIFSKIKKYRRKIKTLICEYKGQTNSEGNFPLLLHTYRKDIKINLYISFISLTESAKKYDLGNKVAHVRDEKLLEMHRKFCKLVQEGKLKPNQSKIS
ncbi:hypothetical protein ES703_10077 [subsurface metagenome]